MVLVFIISALLLSSVCLIIQLRAFSKKYKQLEEEVYRDKSKLQMLEEKYFRTEEEFFVHMRRYH